MSGGRRPPLLLATVACGVLGVALMVPFEGVLARAVGVVALFAFIVCGTFLIASPATLERDDDDRPVRSPR